MADEKFDAIVVGAGPAGVSAGITMARAGLNVVLLERGQYAGAKNVQGAVLYTKMLDEIIPGFWKDPACPLERPVTEQRAWMLSKDSMIQGGFKSARWRAEPHNAYTILRAKFDRWYAAKAEEAGVQLFTGVTVKEGIRKDGRVAGVKTSEGDEILADVVVAADGVNSLLGQQLGLLDEWKPDEVALGVKEVLALPKEKIEDRFNLEPNDGATIEMLGDATRGMLGYCFLYTNKESLSFGVGVKLSHLQKTRIRPPDLLEYAKNHPMVRRLLEGAKTMEYSAHLIPEGGFHSMPKLYADGFLIAGDAAQMVNAAHREGSNLAMTAGRLAGETVIGAKKKGDFSAKTLVAYQQKLEHSFVLPDLFHHRDLESRVEKHMAMLREGPELLAQSALEYLTVDGRPKHEVQRAIFQRVLRSRAVKEVARSEITPRNEFNLVKLAIKARIMVWKLMHGGNR